MAVHIDEVIKQHAKQIIEQGIPSVDTFREVQYELFAQMNQDYLRFLSTDYHRKCMRELEKEEHLRGVLENSEML